MKKYTLEVFIDEKAGIVSHETADALNALDARLIMSVLDEHKHNLLGYIMSSTQTKDIEKKGKKVE